MSQLRKRTAATVEEVCKRMYVKRHAYISDPCSRGRL